MKRMAFDGIIKEIYPIFEVIILLKAKILAIAVFLLSLFILQGCGKDVVQEDLLNYINTELPKVADKENQVLNDYASVTGDKYTSDEVVYNTLNDKIMPTYAKFINDLEKIKPSTPEVQKIHEQYVTAANTQQNAFIMIVSAIEKQDSAELASANEKLASTRQLLREWEASLKQLADKHGVKIDPPKE
ncbi:hypothetical protein [Brevibacillus centrosporus]|uniref:hypothetical protein n=1 Tax=Brevibacillus centrosporus TaxID=54910 RepID=UPI002E22A8B3|nr:hypothetical protein [Brevibacillus centrosporus]